MLRRGEHGNVFFTLFGAVALVGVVGAATSQLARGPLGTVVRVNQQAKADAQMQIAHKLAMLEAARQADSGDCDGDGYVEPIGAKTTGCSPSPSGGGCLPDNIGASKNDPWGTNYGYCSWDHGNTIGSGCGPDGGNNLDGTNSSTSTVIAVISAGPDRNFQTGCGDDPTYVNKPSGSDDLVLDITYGGAVEASGGLWSLKSGSPDTATIDKNIDVPGSVSFQSGGMFSGGAFSLDNTSLDFGENSMLNLPNNYDGSDPNGFPEGSKNAQCNSGNYGSLRINYTSGTVLEICDSTNDWAQIGGAGSGAGAQGDAGAVQLSDGSGNFTEDGANFNYVGDTLAVPRIEVGTEIFSSSGLLTLNDDVDINGALEIAGNLTNSGGNVVVDDGFTVKQNAIFEMGLRVDGDITADDNDVRINDDLVVTGNGNFATLDVTGATSLGGTLDVAGNVFNSSGSLTLADDVIITGEISNSGGNVTINDALDVTGDILGTSFQDYDNPGGDGMFFGSAGELQLRTNSNTGLEIFQTGAVHIPGDLGVGTASPAVKLDVDGEIRLRSSGYAQNDACFHHGSLAYSSGDTLLVCSSITDSWESIGTSGGGGSGVGGVWDDENGYIRYEDSTYITDAGTALTFAPVLQGAGTRFLWYTSAASLRAGNVTGSQWDDSNVGAFSTAFGFDTMASGETSFAAGDRALATTEDAIAIGSQVEARATQSLALGNQAVVAAGATNSMALGLGTVAGAAPQVLGANSLGIFMGDQSGMSFNAADTMGVFGGDLIVSDGTETVASGTLLVDIEGDLGPIQYCDETGANCFLPGDVTGGTIGAPGNDREIVFNSGGVLYASSGFVITSAGRMGIGTDSPDSILHIEHPNHGHPVILSNQGRAWLDFKRTNDGNIAGGLRWKNSTNSIRWTLGHTSNSNNELHLYDSTAPILTFMQGGNIGIGTTTPATALDVAGLMRAIDDAAGCTATERGAIRFNSAGAVMELCDGAAWQDLASGSGTGTAAGADRQIQFNSGGVFYASSTLVFDAAGNLEISTDGSSKANPRNIGFVDLSSNDDEAGRFHFGTGSNAIQLAWGDSLQIYSYWGTEIRGDRQSQTAPSFLRIDGTNLRIVNERAVSKGLEIKGAASQSGDYFKISSSGGTGNIMAVQASGNVGIGTTSPAVPLDVSGVMRAIDDAAGCTATERGAIRFNSAGGALELCDGSAWDGVGGGGGASALDDLSDAITSYSSASMYLGQGSGTAVSSGTHNVALGVDTLQNCDGCTQNVAVGYNAGFSMTGGDYNILMGYGVGDSITDGDANVVIGDVAGRSLQTGNHNTFIGDATGNKATGSDNTIVGFHAGMNFAAGNDNTFLGRDTGATLTDGSDNILIGAAVDVPTATTSDHLNIGDTIYGDLAAGNIGIGTASPDVALDVAGDIEYTGTITDVSDARLKTDITPLDAKDVIGRLSQIDTYSFRMSGDENGQLELGVMAQEVEKIFPELVKTANDEMGTKSVNYIGFIAPMIEAIKELTTANDNRAVQVEVLRAENAQLRAALEAANDNQVANAAAIDALRQEMRELKAAGRGGR